MFTLVKPNTIDQHEKLKNAINQQESVCIKMDVNGGGNHVFFLNTLANTTIGKGEADWKTYIEYSSKQETSGSKHSTSWWFPWDACWISC